MITRMQYSIPLCLLPVRKCYPVAPQQHPEGIVPVQIVPAVPFIGGLGQVHQLRRFAAEGLKGMLVSGQQRRQQLQPPLLPQALQAGVHHRGADPLLVVGPKLLVAQPEQKFLRVQVHFRGDLGQLVKPIACFSMKRRNFSGITESDDIM